MGFMQELAKVIKWGTEAGVSEAIRAHYLKEEPEFTTSMGLWQNFQSTFPSKTWVGDYDLAVYVGTTAYESAVKACYESLLEQDRFVALQGAS